MGANTLIYNDIIRKTLFGFIGRLRRDIDYWVEKAIKYEFSVPESLITIMLADALSEVLEEKYFDVCCEVSIRRLLNTKNEHNQMRFDLVVFRKNIELGAREPYMVFEVKTLLAPYRGRGRRVRQRFVRGLFKDLKKLLIIQKKLRDNEKNVRCYLLVVHPDMYLGGKTRRLWPIHIKAFLESLPIKQELSIEGFFNIFKNKLEQYSLRRDSDYIKDIEGKISDILKIRFKAQPISIDSKKNIEIQLLTSNKLYVYLVELELAI